MCTSNKIEEIYRLLTCCFPLTVEKLEVIVFLPSFRFKDASWSDFGVFALSFLTKFSLTNIDSLRFSKLWCVYNIPGNGITPSRMRTISLLRMQLRGLYCWPPNVKILSNFLTLYNLNKNYNISVSTRTKYNFACFI